MTDIPYEDDEDHTEDVVTVVFVKHMAKIVIAFMGKLLFFLVLALGLRVFAVISLWHVPAWAVGFIVALIVADLVWRVARVVQKTRKSRRLKAERAHMTVDQRSKIELDDMKARQAKFDRERRLRSAVRRPTWWANKGIVLTYTGCFGLVITHWTGNTIIGASAAAGVTVMATIIRSLIDRMMPGMTAMSAFLDARERPDSPEI